MICSVKHQIFLSHPDGQFGVIHGVYQGNMLGNKLSHILITGGDNGLYARLRGSKPGYL